MLAPLAARKKNCSAVLDGARTMTRRNLLLLLGLLLVLASVFALFVSLHKVEIVPMSFVIDENGGFDLNTSALTFGKIPPGAYGERGLTIENDKWRPVFARVFVSEEIVSFMSFEDSFFISAGKNVSVIFRVDVPRDAEFGLREGKVRI